LPNLASEFEEPFSVVKKQLSQGLLQSVAVPDW
jgi:hypothetical protein